MNYLTAHSEAGANILAKSGYILRQVSWVVDGFEYVFEVPSDLPDRGQALAGSSLLSSDDVAKGMSVLSISIPADKSDPNQDSASSNKILRISGADALLEQFELGKDFKGTLRLDFEGIFHDGTVIRATVERQA